MGKLRALLPNGFFSKREFRLRVCGHCELMDWLVSPESLAKVKEKFSKESSG